MKLDEYFRLPSSQRLSRRELAKRLSAKGHKITGEAVGGWIRKNKVPDSWVPFVETVVNESLIHPDQPEVKIEPTEKAG